MKQRFEEEKFEETITEEEELERENELKEIRNHIDQMNKSNEELKQHIESKNCIEALKQFFLQEIKAMGKKKGRKTTLDIISSNRLFKKNRSLKQYQDLSQIIHSDSNYSIRKCKKIDGNGNSVPVVLRFLPFDTPEEQKNAKNEIQIFKKWMNYPQIIEIFAIFKDSIDGHSYIILEMENCETSYVRWLKGKEIGKPEQMDYFDLLKSPKNQDLEEKEIQVMLERLARIIFFISTKKIGKGYVTIPNLMVSRTRKSLDLKIIGFQSCFNSNYDKRYDTKKEFSSDVYNALYALGIMVFESLVDPSNIPEEYSTNSIRIPDSMKPKEKDLLRRLLHETKQQSFSIINHASFNTNEFLNRKIAILEEFVNCGICKKNKKDIKFTPCSHFCCSVCAEQLFDEKICNNPRRCPFCRSDIQRKEKVFLN